MNRRNVLIGLGTAVVGGGAAFGSGAFSQVEADRTVSINTADDSNALLQLSIDGNYSGLSNTGGDQIQLDISSLNENAITTFDSALTIRNAGSNEVNVKVSNMPDALSFEYGDGNGGTNKLSDTPATLSADGGNQSFDVKVDLKSYNLPGSDPDITITATDTSR
ncbi:hypothetical protein [Halostella litorea]|uniref:hypothetical protein n=1 Tax=Halostella litorea TaxID=2528831 RepID=UPI001092985C|nr:hypothetical protein [Halostella litorea]